MQGQSVDEYLARLPARERRVLEELRRTITALVPSVEEAIRVGVPQFRIGGRPLVSVGAAKHHLSLYVMYSNVLPQLGDRLDEFDWTDTVVRFTAAAPLPGELVARIVEARLAELGLSPPADPPGAQGRRRRIG